MRVSYRFRLSALACLIAAGVPALGQGAYPSKAVRLVVPFPPGGSPDILARTIGQKITEATGAAVVIENVPGAGGTIGADRVAKASPDGYTLLMGHVGTLAFAPLIYPQLPYDPVKSFAPVAWVAFANQTLRDRIEPHLHALLAELREGSGTQGLPAARLG